MALSKIWVFAEAADGQVATITLEILAKARELADAVEAFVGRRRQPPSPRRSARTAPRRCYATGDLGGTLAGRPCRRGLAAAISGGDAPDAIFFGTTYDGRDVAARLSVKLDAPVITNIVDLEERRRDRSSASSRSSVARRT